MPPKPRSALAVLALVAVLASCDKGSRQDRFCGRLADAQAELAVVPQDPDELDGFVDRYRDLADIAPLAIEEQWQTITELVEAVATADLTDPATADRLRDQAVAASRAVDEVRAYAQSTCGVDLLVTAVPATTSATVLPDGTATTLPPTTVPPTLPPTLPAP